MDENEKKNQKKKKDHTKNGLMKMASVAVVGIGLARTILKALKDSKRKNV